MNDLEIARVPAALSAIEAETRGLGFDMPSERQAGALLRSLAASKPQGRFLELGTGTGLSTAWLLDGMDRKSLLLSLDIDARLSAVAERHLGQDRRLTLIVDDALAWLGRFDGQPFDLIFADALPGKYEGFDLAWRALAPGGFYVIDDMLPQANWPEGHAAKVERLLGDLDERADSALVRMNWSSGIVLAVRTTAN